MNTLQEAYRFMESAIEAFTSQPFWKIKYSIILAVFAIFYATPPYHTIPERKEHNYWQRVAHQINHPLTPFPVENIDEHVAKKTFRLTVPLVARFFLFFGRQFDLSP